MSLFATATSTARRNMLPLLQAAVRERGTVSRQLPARPFSSFPQLRSAANDVPKGNGNPGSDLGYSPRQIWRRASPRARFWILIGLAVATAAESTFWFKFAPQVFGGNKGEEGAEK